MTRKFKLIDSNRVELMPRRSTKYAAGYDLRASQDYTIPSQGKIWSNWLNMEMHRQKHVEEMDPIMRFGFDSPIMISSYELNPVMIKTGVKVEMKPNDYAIMASRSSNATKRFLMEPNGIGVIDADYHGELMMPLINFGPDDIVIRTGQRIGQLIFQKYKTVDDDEPLDVERTGGFGSTGD